MATLNEIRDAMAEAIETDGWQVSAFPLANPTSPALEVGRRSALQYDKAFQRGHDRWQFVVRALVAFTTDVGAQRRLSELVGPEGIKAMLEDDRQLGDLVEDLHVTEVSGDSVYPRGGTDYIGCEWTVVVIAPGS
jgi:hypothetical protein